MLLNGGFFIETKNTIGAVALFCNVKFNDNTSVLSRGSQRDVVYLGGPIVPSYTYMIYEPKCGRGGYVVSANVYNT